MPKTSKRSRNLYPGIPCWGCISVTVTWATGISSNPRNLANATRIATASVQAIGRTIDFCHVPVPRDRYDDAYFAPLADWPENTGKLFLGLVHHTDGVEGTRRRLMTAKRYIDNFGIATECGFGRRPKETLPELMRIHREIAELL